MVLVHNAIIDDVVAGALTLSLLNLDGNGKIIKPGSTTVPAQRIFYGAIDAGITLASMVGFELRLGLSEYGPLEGYVACAEEWMDHLPQNGIDVNGQPLQCRATTRRGTACQRMPLPHNGYCPSHQHLAETEEVEVRARQHAMAA